MHQRKRLSTEHCIRMRNRHDLSSTGRLARGYVVNSRRLSSKLSDPFRYRWTLVRHQTTLCSRPNVMTYRGAIHRRAIISLARDATVTVRVLARHLDPGYPEGNSSHSQSSLGYPVDDAVHKSSQPSLSCSWCSRGISSTRTWRLFTCIPKRSCLDLEILVTGTISELYR